MTERAAWHRILFSIASLSFYNVLLKQASQKLLLLLGVSAFTHLCFIIISLSQTLTFQLITSTKYLALASITYVAAEYTYFVAFMVPYITTILLAMDNLSIPVTFVFSSLLLKEQIGGNKIIGGIIDCHWRANRSSVKWYGANDISIIDNTSSPEGFRFD
jgi:hypothetical protein